MQAVVCRVSCSGTRQFYVDHPLIANENRVATRQMRAFIDDAVLPAAEHLYLYIYRSGQIPGTCEIIARQN